MTKMIVASLPVTDLKASVDFYKAVGFALNPQFSGDTTACMVWGDAIQRAAAAHGGQAHVNPAEDHGFMYSRDLADPDGHMWGTFWMDPAPARAPDMEK